MTYVHKQNPKDYIMLLFNELFYNTMIHIYRDVKRIQKDMIHKIKSISNVFYLILSITINTNMLL